MNSLRSELMALYARLLKGKPVDAGDAVTVIAASERIETLEIRCADKDASIQQLIEQLQKAEAQLGGVAQTTERQPDNGDKSVGSRHGPATTSRTSGETK